MKVASFIPSFFRERVLWVLWKLEKNEKGKWTKVPYSALTGRKASSTNPGTWCSFSEAVKEFRNGKSYSGLGVVIAKELNIVFIDIDHSIDPETGELNEIGEDILRSLPGTYAEVSQSGTGLHLFVLGTIPRDFKNSKYGVEMYSSGRYCCLTGKAIQPFEPIENQEALSYIFGKYKTADTPERKSVPIGKHECTLSESEIISKAKSSNYKFSVLYSGDWRKLYASQSEADMAMCLILAFWCDRDQEMMDSIFRSSNLYRNKWNEKRGGMTYGEVTISKAVDVLPETLSEWRKRQNEDFANCILQEW